MNRFALEGVPFARRFWDRDEAGMSTLIQHGLALTETHTALFLDLSETHRTPPHVEGLEIKPVTTAPDLLQFGEVIPSSLNILPSMLWRSIYCTPRRSS
jgi:hypothetical protein